MRISPASVLVPTEHAGFGQRPKLSPGWFRLSGLAALIFIFLDGGGSRALALPQPIANVATTATSAADKVQGRWASLGFQTRIVHANGVNLHLAEAGQGSAVVLLHGYPQSGEAWRFVAPELAKSHHVLVVDLRGMGLSEIATSGYELDNVAEDIHQLIQALGIKKVQVVGHDWGAAVGAVYAMRYREEVLQLAFLESALAGAGFEALWDFRKPNDAFTFIPFLLLGESDTGLDTTAELIRGHESIWLHHLWQDFTGDKQAAPFSGWTPYVDAMTRPGLARSSASYYRAAYRSADEVRALIKRKLQIPVLSISGANGIGSKQEKFVRAFASNVKGSLVISGAGHFLPEERPAQVNAALSTFLTQ
jgi:pimeloyl-ACP methyl ester carboxylesterase